MTNLSVGGKITLEMLPCVLQLCIIYVFSLKIYKFFLKTLAILSERSII